MLCLCHDVEMSWHTDARKRAGGYWECIVKKRERDRTRAKNPVEKERVRRYRSTLPPEYGVWSMMKDRCTNPFSKDFSRYGRRGISVCARWMSFKNFMADMGPRPSPKHSIDRINNDGNYEPDNCRWATATEQARNRSTA